MWKDIDRKRKLIFYRAKHKRRLAAENTLTDIEMITYQTEHSKYSTIINNNNQLDIDEYSNASSSICDFQVDFQFVISKKIEISVNLTMMKIVMFSNENNSYMAQNYEDTNSNQIIVDNSILNENLCLNDKEEFFMHDISIWAIDEIYYINHSINFYRFCESTLFIILYLKTLQSRLYKTKVGIIAI